MPLFGWSHFYAVVVLLVSFPPLWVALAKTVMWVALPGSIDEAWTLAVLLLRRGRYVTVGAFIFGVGLCLAEMASATGFRSYVVLVQAGYGWLLPLELGDECPAEICLPCLFSVASFYFYFRSFICCIF